MEAAALLLLAILADVRTSAAQSLSSAPIDRAIFRDGEVTRTTRTFADWVLLCDEVIRLKRRFCSLRTALQDDRRIPMTLDVSTGDDGRPAALLHLPTNVGVAEGVVLGVSGPRSAKAKGRVHPIAVCSATECQSVWSLTSFEIDALSTRKGLAGTYRTAGLDDLPILSVRLHPMGVQHFQISGKGFREAIEASVR